MRTPLNQKKPKVPERGAFFTLKGTNIHCDYRATALAMMRRMNFTEVDCSNGHSYTLEEIKESIIGSST